MTREEWITIGAAALKAEDKRRREDGIRPYSETSLRYDIAARIVYDAFVKESMKTGEAFSAPA